MGPCHMGPSINYAQVVLIKSVKNETLSNEDLQNVNYNKKRQHISISVGPQGVHVMSGWQHQTHPLKWGGKWGPSSSYRADGLRTAATDVVRVLSGGRNQIGRLTAVRRGRSGRPWWTRRCKTFKRRPSIYFNTSYPLWHASRNLSLNSKVNVLISGAHGH
jgi:hypothetical protein